MRAPRFLIVISCILLSPVGLIGQQETGTDIETAQLSPMKGQVVRYVSTLFNDREPMAICATDSSDKPKALIVDLSPGTLSRLRQAARSCEIMCRYAKEQAKSVWRSGLVVEEAEQCIKGMVTTMSTRPSRP